MHRLGVLFAALASCTAGPAEDRASDPSSRTEAVWFEALFAEHCLRADRSVDPAEVKRLQLRLAELWQQAVSGGLAGDVEAAERQWTDFAARAEFVCEPGAADRMNEQMDRLIMSMQSGR